MQGKDPFLLLFGLFILGATFFFCGERSVTLPPPVTLENPAEIPPPVSNSLEPPVSVTGRTAMMPGYSKCWFWTLVGAGLLGWGIKGLVLGPVIDDKRREVERLMSKVTMLANQPPEIRTVEKRVEVPVERVVVKRIEVPVEKVVDRPVDNPEHLARIKALEGEVAMIAGLFTQIAQLKPFSSQAGERRIEGRVVVPVDNPEQQARIKTLEGEVAVIAELRAQIAELRALSLQAGEKEKVVDTRTETPPEEHVVQNREVPGEAIRTHAGDRDRPSAIEPSDESQVADESPDDLKHIRGVGPALERFLHKRGVFWFSQVATWRQSDVEKFEFLLPNFSGRIQREHWVRSAQVEHYKKYQQWLGDGEPPSDSPEHKATVSQAGEKVIEKQIESPTERFVGQNGGALGEAIRTHGGDREHPSTVEPSHERQVADESPDDLKHIRGVGPALERFLHKRGVFWFRQVASWSQADIDKFEFLLPNFSGRIQREHWVRSAQIEHYKKYQQWLGDGEPPCESPELRIPSGESHAAVSADGEKKVEKRITASTEPDGERLIDKGSERAVGLSHASAVEPSDESQVADESPDDLKQIRGVGPALERFLHKRGVFWFRQVASWSQADIEKFEFLLPNFSGRIQREHWVRSAQIEHYKKYQQWLGDSEPPSESPELRMPSVESHVALSQAGEKVIETRIETPAEKLAVQNGEMSVEAINEHTGGLDHSGTVELSDESYVTGESPDDLKQIRGVGPGLERFLHKRGVFWFRQVASWNQADIEKFEFLLPNFSGRIQRENWVQSARLEYYKKYKKSLGDDGPTNSTPEMH